MSLLLSSEHANPKLACFIHSTTLEFWHDEFLITQLELLKKSGLLSKLHYLCIINTGLPINISDIQSRYPPAKIIHYSKYTQEFENITIKMLYTFCQYHPDYKVLYMHTKVVSYPRDHVFLPGIHSWNQFMMYSLITNYQKCLRLMHIYDTVGCNFRPFEDGNNQHYSGNFWWARANYVNKVPIDYMKNKYDPEFWLLQSKPMYFNIHTLEHMYQQTYPVENYREDVERGFGDNIHFCKVGFAGTGLCNQLYCIVNTLVLAATQEGNKAVILDDFLEDIFTNREKPSCDVLDLAKCNAMLKPYNITMMYKNHITMKLHCVLFGLRHVGTVDITAPIQENFMSPNHLYIPKGTFITPLADHDPCPNVRKQIYVYYSLNDVMFQQVFYEEKLLHRESVEIKHSNYDGKPHRSEVSMESPWLQRINRKDSVELRDLFDFFLRSLVFQSRFIDQANQHLEMVQIANPNTTKIHVLHLRNEIDAIKHWSTINNLSEPDYQYLYENTVKKHVLENIPKGDTILILSAYVDHNPVLQYLKDEGYQCFLREKESIGRELNGIVDLLIGKACTGVFIGNFIIVPSTGAQEGSTFSFTLYNQITDCEKVCMIDMDNLTGNA